VYTGREKNATKELIKNNENKEEKGHDTDIHLNQTHWQTSHRPNHKLFFPFPSTVDAPKYYSGISGADMN
jgi:hypothetical protein